MASLDAGYDRAAMLKQAARRNHFVSRIEKYEAKVKQDLKARGLLREQRIAMAPVFKTRGALEQKMHSTGKTISDKSLTVEDNRKACDSVAEKAKHDALVEHNICHLGESEDYSSEQNILAGKREILHSTLHDHCKASDFVEGKGKSKKDDAFIERRTCQSGESEDSSEHKIISQQKEILHSTVRDHKSCGLIAEKAKLKKENAMLEHRTCHLGDRVDSSQQKIMAERMEVQHSTVLDHRACNWVAEKVKPKKIDGWLEHRTCQSGGREDSPEQKIIAEQREIPLLHRLAQSEKERATTSSSIIYHPGRSYALETKALPAVSGQLLSACRPSAATELNIAAIAVVLKIRLKAADMSPPMQEHAFRLARDILNSIDKLQCKRVAYTLKKEFDKTYGPAWHCIVGTNFGSYVTHSLGGFIYFSLEKVSVLLFKTAVEPLEH